MVVAGSTLVGSLLTGAGSATGVTPGSVGAGTGLGVVPGPPLVEPAGLGSVGAGSLGVGVPADGWDDPEPGGAPGPDPDESLEVVSAADEAPAEPLESCDACEPAAAGGGEDAAAEGAVCGVTTPPAPPAGAVGAGTRGRARTA